MSSRCRCVAASAPALPLPSVGRSPQCHRSSISVWAASGDSDRDGSSMMFGSRFFITIGSAVASPSRISSWIARSHGADCARISGWPNHRMELTGGGVFGSFIKSLVGASHRSPVAHAERSAPSLASVLVSGFGVWWSWFLYEHFALLVS